MALAHDCLNRSTCFARVSPSIIVALAHDHRLLHGIPTMTTFVPIESETDSTLALGPTSDYSSDQIESEFSLDPCARPDPRSWLRLRSWSFPIILCRSIEASSLDHRSLIVA